MLLGVGVEVAAVERARIEGVEQLRHFPDVQFDRAAFAYRTEGLACVHGRQPYNKTSGA